jgi:gas vesicle protein
MRFILGLIIGIAIGAAIGTLRAPQSGSATREALQQRMRDLTGEPEEETTSV